MKKITNSVYTFEDLIKDGFLYVDKTEYIWNLIGQGKGMYFLSRPRRFGKSLTVSTLMAIFEGKKELFKGLAIYDKPYDWKPYPVIHLDMGNCSAKTPKELKLYLVRLLESQCREHQVRVKIQQEALSSSFEDFIDAVAGTGQVVLLLDEYDKPILNTLTSPEAAECRDVLKGFYSTIKKCESKERFVFVTGVSKFCHVSLFSDLNNLNDISMDYDYATMCGYTQAELEKYFADRIELACEQLKMPREELLAEIAAWYDGYRFHAEAESVYNPVSLALFFSKRYEFNNYWVSTGTPEFLMKLIRENNFDFQNILSNPVSSVAFEAFEVDNIDPLSLLLQTGYLTIKSSIKERNMPWYYLDFPNREVGDSFNTYLLNAYTKKSRRDITNFCRLLENSMETGDIEQLRTTLEVFFSGIQPPKVAFLRPRASKLFASRKATGTFGGAPTLRHSVRKEIEPDNAVSGSPPPYSYLRGGDESNFQNIFFTIFHLLGYDIKAESHTSCGRIDAVVQTDDWIYLFEFKLNKDKSALEQIKESIGNMKTYLPGGTSIAKQAECRKVGVPPKVPEARRSRGSSPVGEDRQLLGEYFKPFLLSRKRIMLIGANFDTETGKLSNWKNEELVKNQA